jgi:transposase
MPLVREIQHPKSLSFAEQRRVVRFRDAGDSWETIAGKVWNLQRKRPTWGNCRNVYNRFNRRSNRAKYKYRNCGRKKTLTPEHERWMLAKFLQLRKKGPCTAPMLQRLLACKRKVRVEVSLVQKRLRANGYKWLRRNKKPKYDDAQKVTRKAFVGAALRLTVRQLREKFSMAWDGVVIGVPPKTGAQRVNFLRQSETHCWRKPSEAADPDLAGSDNYKKQVPLSRAIPLWGGISEVGFVAILWHKKHKMDHEEWVEGIEDGYLAEAIKSLKPAKRAGPWHVLSDNESFLLTDEARAEYRKQKVRLWPIPARSPDLNPIELFWAWVSILA